MIKDCPGCHCTKARPLLSIPEGWRIFCPGCLMMGPIGVDETDALTRWNALPRQPVYAEQPPISPGWYFQLTLDPATGGSYESCCSIAFPKYDCPTKKNRFYAGPILVPRRPVAIGDA